MEVGKLRQGERIDDKELYRILGVSRTPIREALIQLKNEEFIEIIPRCGIEVKKISLKEIEEIYNIIGTLEAKAAGIAVDKLKDEDISRMEELFKK